MHTTKRLPRLLIADDHLSMLEGLTRLLSEHFEVIATATNGRDLLETARRLTPDVIVLDIGLPEMNGIEAGRRISREMPASKIVFVTQHLEGAYVQVALAAGAMGYVAKQSASAELINAIRLALNGQYFVTPLARRSTQDDTNSATNPIRAFRGRFTVRQREVLQLIAEGKTTKEIASILNITVKTVEFHRAGLMDELGIRTIAELTRYAIRSGISS